VAHAAVSGDTSSVNHPWNEIDNYCMLCKEPFGQWNEHRGKRDHITLELFFDVVVEQSRMWNPAHVWGSFERRFAPRSAIKRLHADLGDPTSAYIGVDHRVLDPKGLTMRALFQHHDGMEFLRRQEIFALVKHLRDRGAIFLGPAQWRDPQLCRVNMGQQGALVMYKWQHPEITHLFPLADAKQVSSFSQLCASMYNLETVFDFCGLQQLVDMRDMPPTANGQLPTEMSFFQKSIILRNMLGQIRWALEGNTTPSRVPDTHPIALQATQGDDFWTGPSSSSSSSAHGASSDLKAAFSDARAFHARTGKAGGAGAAMDEMLKGQFNHNASVAVLAEYLGRGIINEMLFCRLTEFVTRTEIVWRELGCPSAPPVMGWGTSTQALEHRASQVHLAGRGPALAAAMELQIASHVAETAAALGPQSSSIRKDAHKRDGWADESRFCATMTAGAARKAEKVERGVLGASGPAAPLRRSAAAYNMIQCCTHNALGALLGPAHGAINVMSGGEYMEMAIASAEATDATLFSTTGGQQQNSPGAAAFSTSKGLADLIRADTDRIRRTLDAEAPLSAAAASSPSATADSATSSPTSNLVRGSGFVSSPPPPIFPALSTAPTAAPTAPPAAAAPAAIAVEHPHDIDLEAAEWASAQRGGNRVWATSTEIMDLHGRARHVVTTAALERARLLAQAGPAAEKPKTHRPSGNGCVAPATLSPTATRLLKQAVAMSS
jgi:hypothetical protein